MQRSTDHDGAGQHRAVSPQRVLPSEEAFLYAMADARCALRVDVLNHALVGIPAEQVRYHLCWGSWHGPHAFDLPLQDIVDLLLRVNAGAYLIEAADARHEHEYLVWDDVKLPEGKVLVAGVVSHHTDTVEHPDLVALRIQRYAERVGKENVIAGADCGFGGRSHPQVGWAKLRVLAEGAERATRALRGLKSQI
ncbi:MAG: hypothetical protein JO057_31320 [Chloroflexi bacterium]|nr:hypothetical protein [Chloroflexota bacterium]